MISISVIIPAYNEDSTLLALLKKYTYLKDKALFELIIVNDGSTDNTKKIIEENKTLYNKAIHLKKNRGKGKSVIEGLKNSTCDYVFFQDADLEYDPMDIVKFIDIVNQNKADLVLGSRLLDNKKGIFYFSHKIGNKLITFIFNILNKSFFSDICCCYCLFKKKNLPIQNLKSYGWGQHIEILTYLLYNSDKTFEVPVSYKRRKYSENKKIRYYHFFEVIFWVFFTKLKIFFK